MNIPASIATVLAIIGFFLIFNGSAMQREAQIETKIEKTEIVLDNNQAYGLNMRKFIGFLCLLGAGGAAFAGLGLTTVRQAGLDEEPEY